MLKTHYSHKLKFTFITLALLFLLIPQLPSNISNTYEFNDNKPHINKITNSSLLRVGIGTKPVFHDPVDVWDPGSLNVLDQVAEGLFSYNLSDPSLQMVPTLAEDFGTWSDNKNYVVDIKQGITFHDGTSLNATAVKFTFDRLLYWTNATGIIMDENDLAITTELFKWPNGTQIINRIEILGPYTVRFVLNHAYQLFVHLLTFSACYIISMSHGIEKIGPGETHEFPIGTGPFIYENWVGDELVFSRNDDYWQGPSEIKSLIFSYVEDANARNVNLLTGDIHFLVDPLPSFMPLFDLMENITLVDSNTTGLETVCIGMSNLKINTSFREIFTYAIDYDFIIDIIMEGNAERLKSPIPNGMIFANDTNDYPIYNITKARLLMQKLNYGDGLDIANDTQWIALANTNPIMSLNYTWNADNLIGGQIGVLLLDNLELIGCKGNLMGMSYTNYTKQLYGRPPYSKGNLDLFFYHWLPYYIDPSIYINPIYEQRFHTSTNSLLFRCWPEFTYLDTLMKEGLNTTDIFERKKIYDKIQNIIIEDAFPMVYMYTPEIIYAHHSNLTGFQQNKLNKFIFYPCHWELEPLPFNLTSTANYPDKDGDFILNWTESENAMNYSVYHYSQFITEINNSLTPLILETEDLSFPINGFTSGDYYFIVEAHNLYGNTSSNCIKVSVRIPPRPFTLYSDTGTTDDDGNFNLNWDISVYADNYSVYQYSDFITEINGSLTPLILETEDLTFPISILTNDDYYFIVEAYNMYGNNISNCIRVSIQIPPGPINLWSNADSPDKDGTFSLFWNSSSNAISYSIYQYDTFITEINGSLIPLTEDTLDHVLPLVGYQDGEYYFIATAHNDYGDTLSICIKVVVSTPKPAPPVIPGYNLFFIMLAVNVLLFICYKKKFKNQVKR